MIFNNFNFLPIPKYCQTCGVDKEDIVNDDDNCHYAFCSTNCFNIASITHYGGAIIALQFFQGEPCLILIKDKVKYCFFKSFIKIFGCLLSKPNNSYGFINEHLLFSDILLFSVILFIIYYL